MTTPTDDEPKGELILYQTEEAYLAVVDRVLLEQFLECITARRVFAKGDW